MTVTAALFVVLVGLDPASPSGFGDIAAIYGLAAPPMIFLLGALRVLWRELKEARAEIVRLRDQQLDSQSKLIPLLSEATTALERELDARKEREMAARITPRRQQ